MRSLILAAEQFGLLMGLPLMACCLRPGQVTIPSRSSALQHPLLVVAWFFYGALEWWSRREALFQSRRLRRVWLVCPACSRCCSPDGQSEPQASRPDPRRAWRPGCTAHRCSKWKHGQGRPQPAARRSRQMPTVAGQHASGAHLAQTGGVGWRLSPTALTPRSDGRNGTVR